MTSKTAEWIDRAKADLLGAQILSESEGLENLVSYHCHQSAEKAFKAVLVEREVSFPKTHDLPDLADLVEGSGVAVDSVRNVLAVLNAYSMAPRYPGFETSVGDLPKLLEIAKTILAFCLKVIG